MTSAPRNLVVCSDGTGNSGRGTIGTNVWRVRQAVQAFDRHRAGDRDRPGAGNRGDEIEQLMIYQDGVGTEAFKPLKMLGLAFSYGVTQDLEYLYERLMLQYREGDRIFLFGFSRGAFTIRSLAYMLYLCGLADPFDENGRRRTAEEISQIAKDAVIAYKMRHLGYHVTFRQKYGRILQQPQAPAWGPDAVRDLPEEFTRGRVRIQFVGVWDTVSAVGLPFHNFTQAFLTFWRGVTTFFLLRWAKLSLLNMKRPTNQFWTCWEDDLHPYIANAYQALSLDDERETFYPMLWLQKQACHGDPAAGVIRRNVVARRMSSILRRETVDEVEAYCKQHPGEGIPGLNVEQVWFAGMHSDVGGGYDKDQLAHVSLMWMMAHASRCGLQFSRELVTEYAQRADALGKMHDSRSGAAIFYRYNPRDVEWFSVDAGISGQPGDHPLIHESVFCRIEDSSQAYAPRHIPFAERYDVVQTPAAVDDPGLLAARSPRLSWDPLDPPNRVVPELRWMQRRFASPVSSSANPASGFAVGLTRVTRRGLRGVSVLLFGWLWVINKVFVRIMAALGSADDEPQWSSDPRQTADHIIHLYVVLRRAAARWILYVILIFAALAVSSGWLDQLARLDAATSRGLGELYRRCFRSPWLARGLDGQVLVPILRAAIVLVALLGLLMLASLVGKFRLKQRDVIRRPYSSGRCLGQFWPVAAPVAAGVGIVVAAIVLRPLAYAGLEAVAPRPVFEMARPLFSSGAAFALLCTTVFAVLWFNGHYARRIENWARYAWDSQRYGSATRPEGFEIWPQSLVEALFSERRIGLGRYIGRFATKTFFPLLSMALLTGAVLGVLWIPIAELLVDASVQQPGDGVRHLSDAPASHIGHHHIPGRLKRQTARRLGGPWGPIRWDADRTLHTRFPVQQGWHYVVTANVAQKLWDANVPGNIDGIDLVRNLSGDPPKQQRSKRLMRSVSAMKRIPAEPYFQLCGTVGGTSEGKPFPIRSGVPFTAPATGELYLFLNDVPGFFANNCGQLLVTVTLVIPEPPQ